jgi:hypothetical protein
MFTVVIACRRAFRVRVAALYPGTVHTHQGLIFPHNPFAEAGGADPPPNLTTSLKEKR